FVAFLCRILVATPRRDREPLVGGFKILLHAIAACIEDGEVELAVGYAKFSCLLEPFDGGRIIGFAAIAGGVKDGEIVHGTGIAGVGRLPVIGDGLVQVLFDAGAFFEKSGKAVLRRCKSTVCGKLVPGGG